MPRFLRSTTNPVAAFSRTALIPATTAFKLGNCGDTATTVPSSAVSRNLNVFVPALSISKLPAIFPFSSTHHCIRADLNNSLPTIMAAGTYQQTY